MAVLRQIQRPDWVRETTGDRVRRLRIRHGWSQEQLAQRAGIRRLSIFEIEHDRRDPLVSTLDALAGSLGVSLQYLWSGDPQCDHDRNTEAAS